jgi:hypothetical protein
LDANRNHPAKIVQKCPGLSCPASFQDDPHPPPRREPQHTRQAGRRGGRRSRTRAGAAAGWRHLATLLAAVALAAAAGAATPPYVALLGATGTAGIAAGTCSATGPTPAFIADIDLGAGGSYRYSPAYVIAYFFDDEGEFNLVYNQDATLLVSPYVHGAGVRLREPLPVAPLSEWYAGFSGMPAHTELALRVATYDAGGRPVATSRITWDCTTGVVTSLEHRGHAVGTPATVRLVEFHHAGLDHYFMSALAGEIAQLDDGTQTGWQRTGLALTVFAAAAAETRPVCRYYLPPASGDSHFYSASPTECAEVGQRFPGFVLESGAVFHAVVPDAAGACAPGTVPVYRLWNQRIDSNHRYTTDRAIRAQMIAGGSIAEGDGPDGVAMCALP